MFLHNIYQKILLRPGPLTGFVLAVRTDCILNGLRIHVSLHKLSTRLDYLAKLYRH